MITIARALRTVASSWEDGGLDLYGAIRAAVPGISSPLGDPSDERQAVMDAMAKAIADELGVDDFEDAWDIAPRQWDPASPLDAETILRVAERLDPTPAAPASPVELITQLRRAGVTVRQIAAAAGVHTSTVYRWARGAFRPQASRMTALATLAV